MPAYAQFDFDLGAAVMDQLIAAFDSLTVGDLTTTVIEQMRPEQGVYQLFLGGGLMYCGKADDLPARLGEHRWNLSGRLNIAGELGFKAVNIHRNWATSVHEQLLISHYRALGESQWNTTGLGNHDPGRNRDDSITEDEHFDSQYPINQNFVPEGVTPRNWNALELLLHLKNSLPYLFRYEAAHYKRGSDKYNGVTINVPRLGMTMVELLQLIIDNFPPGWQATILPGRVILYEENRHYNHARQVIRKG